MSFKIDVITLVYDPGGREQHVIAECLHELQSNTMQDFRHIVIDNGSDSSTSDFVCRELRSHDVYVKNATNLGASHGRNQGLQYCSGEFIANVDSDVVVKTRGWDVQLCEELLRESVDIVAPLTDLTSCEAQKSDGLDVGSHRDAFVWFVPTLCVAMKRLTAWKIGPFDERFTYCMYEDTDYFMRAHLIGLKLKVVGSVFVRHKSDPRMKDRQIASASAVNQKLYAEKWQGI